MAQKSSGGVSPYNVSAGGSPTWRSAQPSGTMSSAFNLVRNTAPFAPFMAGIAQGIGGRPMQYFQPPGTTQPPSGGGGFPTTTGAYRISGEMPSWGGWAWGSAPGARAAAAGFDWFEYGYPDRWNDQAVRELSQGGVRPFAYINLGEAHPSLFSQIGWQDSMGWGEYSTYGARNQPMADLTDPRWQDWLVRRAGQAYQQGARGIKWDVAEPSIRPGKTRAQVNEGIRTVLDRINQQYPGMYHVLNQGWSFANAYPQYVSGMQTESVINNGSWGAQQVAQAQALKAKYNIPTFVAQYADPYSSTARNYYNQIVNWGLVPYIVGTDSSGHHWTTPGWGYNISPGW